MEDLLTFVCLVYNRHKHLEFLAVNEETTPWEVIRTTMELGDITVRFGTHADVPARGQDSIRVERGANIMQ